MPVGVLPPADPTRRASDEGFRGVLTAGSASRRFVVRHPTESVLRTTRTATIRWSSSLYDARARRLVRGA